MRNFISVLLADMDRHILVDVKTSKQKRQTFWRSFLTYLVVFLLSIATILLTFYLLFQGLLNQQIIYYIGALLVFLLAFFMSYQLILYTPTFFKNSVFMVGHVLIRKIKAHRQGKTEKQEKKSNKNPH